ncbi:unnamed protein product [Caenorhabditis angaria]|uniref:STAS domain-containing protein n=1 Tax=Caenorhabditis angaria TaxID=860376 RepID=A0A9P1J5L4_9PELO|nr:unnamed protein product [Caenorhabditis angaria]
MKRKKTSFIKRHIPILDWLPKYDIKENLINDIVGGLTVGFIHVPQGMAYASLAGLKPVYGLYTSLFPGLIYMIFGSSRHVSLGVFAIISLMCGSCNIRVSQEIMDKYNLTSIEDRQEISVEIVKSLGLLVGCFQILLGLIKADYLISYLSDQIVVGFTTGAACHVFTAQLNKMLGVSLPRHTGFGKLFRIYRDLINSVMEDQVNFYTLAISIFTVIFLYSFKYIITPRCCAKTRFPIPYDLFVIIAGTAASQIFSLHDTYHIKIVGTIPKGLPAPKFPDISIFQYVISEALAIAVVSVVVTISMGKVFAKKHDYKIDARQEFFALGMVESISSMFPVWPSSTALARSIINENAGTKTQLSAIISATVLILVLFFIGPLLEPLPTCLLSCVVIVALRGMFMQLQNFGPSFWKFSKIDWIIFTITFLATVIYDIVPGLFIGFITGIAFSIFRIQRTQIIADENDIESSKGIRVTYPSSLLYFNCDVFEKSFNKIIHTQFSTKDEETQMIDKDRNVVFDMSGIGNIDVSGANLLVKLTENLKEQHGISFELQNLTDNTKQFLAKHPSFSQLNVQ